MAINKIFQCDNCETMSPPQLMAVIPQGWFRLQANVTEHKWIGEEQRDHFVENVLLKYFCPNCKNDISIELKELGDKFATILE